MFYESDQYFSVRSYVHECPVNYKCLQLSAANELKSNWQRLEFILAGKFKDATKI